MWINGYGCPMYPGGPMFWAETAGLDEVARKIRHDAETLGGAHWQPTPLLEKLAADGARISGYPN